MVLSRANSGALRASWTVGVGAVAGGWLPSIPSVLRLEMFEGDPGAPGFGARNAVETAAPKRRRRAARITRGRCIVVCFRCSVARTFELKVLLVKRFWSVSKLLLYPWR